MAVLRSALLRARGRHQKSPEAHTVGFPVSIWTLVAEMANCSTNVSIFSRVGGASIRSRGLSVMRYLTPSRIDAKLEKLILDGQGFRVVGKLVTTA